MYKRERRKYCEKLDLKNITDNKKFWKIIKPFLSNKSCESSKISLKEGDEIISDDSEVADILNKHFVNSVRCLADMGWCSSHVFDVNDAKDPLNNIIKRFQHHSSINAIK